MNEKIIPSENASAIEQSSADGNTGAGPGQAVIIGAGLAGLSAALTLAEHGARSILVSAQISERAQSVLAEGGINACLNVMGESDTTDEHFADTMRGGVDLADPAAVRGLVEDAPLIVRRLSALGVPFMMKDGHMIERNFGGQKKKRTAFCKSSTGKALMTAMIDEVRKYESVCVQRLSHHRFNGLVIRGGRCRGVKVIDEYDQSELVLKGPVILAFGGPSGLLPGLTTGTTANDGDALALAFSEGVELANLEMIQYHPTTAAFPGKRLLISEAARGEGGRLFVLRGGSRWYFMEELHPDLGNLAPRDVISREMDRIMRDPDCGDQVFLDLTELPPDVWRDKLTDLREETIHYLGIDPAKEPLPVSPGIHYFMGGIRVDRMHRTNIPGLCAAGECAAQYHGANRLGGNSLLGAIYGGKCAAMTMLSDIREVSAEPVLSDKEGAAAESGSSGRTEPSVNTGSSDAIRTSDEPDDLSGISGGRWNERTAGVTGRLGGILAAALGIIRDEETLNDALLSLETLRRAGCSGTDLLRTALAEAFVRSALTRKESRGAHQRSDYPLRDDRNFRKQTVAAFSDGKITVRLEDIPGAEG